jgi:hypothetical protein
MQRERAPSVPDDVKRLLVELYNNSGYSMDSSVHNPSQKRLFARVFGLLNPDKTKTIRALLLEDDTDTPNLYVSVASFKKSHGARKGPLRYLFRNKPGEILEVQEAHFCPTKRKIKKQAKKRSSGVPVARDVEKLKVLKQDEQEAIEIDPDDI